MKTDYNESRAILTIRLGRSKNIWKFLKELKRRNKCSSWVNAAIREKYEREEE